MLTVLMRSHGGMRGITKILEYPVVLDNLSHGTLIACGLGTGLEYTGGWVRPPKGVGERRTPSMWLEVWPVVGRGTYAPL